MKAFHSVVVGPGLGRKETMVPYLNKFLTLLKNNGPEKRVNLILDADFIYHFERSPEMMTNV